MTGQSYIISTQTAYVVIAALGGYIWDPKEAVQAISILYGGGVSILASMILAWRIRRAVDDASVKQGKGQLHLYLGATERMAITVVGFILGVLKLGLDILPMVVGLLAGQLGFLIGGIKSRI